MTDLPAKQVQFCSVNPENKYLVLNFFFFRNVTEHATFSRSVLSRGIHKSQHPPPQPPPSRLNVTLYI